VPVTPKFSADGRTHFLVQFNDAPGNDVRASLLERGAKIVAYVPDYALLVSAPAGVKLDDLGLRWSGRLAVSDKISPAIEQPANGALLDAADFVVEFHSDVSMNSAREALTSSGIEVRDNPDLAPYHLLIHTTVDMVGLIAEWDEVAYVFPASDDLIGGRPTRACAGALTTAGAVGQYVARVGDGWDGPGAGSAQLSYFFGPMTEQVPTDSTKAEIRRALAEWSRVASVTFVPGASATANRAINIFFANGENGDGYPFDGRGNVLAHTFYPAAPNPEPLAGDMHLDEAEPWRVGSNVDLYSVALHELGHALGLGHSDKPGAVMYPYYHSATSLTAEDVSAILSLYAAAAVTKSPEEPPAPVVTITTPGSQTGDATMVLAGRVSGGTAPLIVRWSTDRGLSGVATGSTEWTANVELQTGVNTIVVTVTDAQQRSASSSISVTRTAAAAPVTLQITGPTASATFSTSSASIVLSGSAADASGIAQISWSNSLGAGGSGSGTTAWTAGPIPLSSGATTFTVRATAQSGAYAEKTIVVTYAPVAGPPDTTAPSLTITTPSSTYYYTSVATLTFVGRASDSGGITSVTWTTNTGKSGRAVGTTAWSAPIPLVSGANYVKIQATDGAGNTSWRTVVVARN